ncbi:alpha/beta hydrolase [[Mycobacterium] wendilense]|uniref:Alpha/beta hydrolase n=1 Tax=[Mycobacterium] wendilense TaxID=3064284 RepID=A0ABM9M891_9MYCO|nr:alpha/beta hydrolase [Mycolicibacterium sp. MU0050]CAJ1578724.1 alpha/beta hydrolase [Mycolicibacterium sp. MU0050]
MTVVLVHGNPETAAIWGPLIAALDRTDIVTLSPPGFGAPLPDGFGATHQDYRDWLVNELTELGESVDLVGHDWGGGHVMNAVIHRPELVRSWATDALGLFDPEYVWHDLAQVWQTPGAGEELVEQMLGGSVEDRTESLVGLGFPADVAAQVAAGQDDAMARAIPLLYRSAVPPGLDEARANLPNAAARPGLSILATEDPYTGSAELRRRAAERAGADTAVLDGLGHWWMLEDPQRAAAALTGFWDSLA